MASSSEADSEGVEEDDETADLLPPRIAFLRSQRGLRAEKGEGAGEVELQSLKGPQIRDVVPYLDVEDDEEEAMEQLSL